MMRQVWPDWQPPAFLASIREGIAAMKGTMCDDRPYDDCATHLARYAEAVAELVRALLAGERDPDSARTLLCEALGTPGMRFVPEAAAFLRRIDQRTSLTARRYRLLVDGACPPEMFDEPTRFMRACEVVADSPEEALRLLHPFVPAVSRTGLSCRRVLSVFEVSPDTLVGVYDATAYCFYRQGAGG